MPKRVFVDELFDGANGDRFRTRVQNTCAFTETFLRANARTDFRQVAGALRYGGGFDERAFSRERDPFGNSIMQRAPFDAQRFRTIKTTARLLANGLLVE